MGCDIHGFAEVKKGGKWVRVTEPVFTEYDKPSCEPFAWRSYSVFSFLADVRNNSGCKPLSEPKGLPLDSEYLNEPSRYGNYATDQYFGEPIPIEERGKKWTDIQYDANYHSSSYLTLKEFLDFDYESSFENRRTSKVFKGENVVMLGSIFDEKAAIGSGTQMTYREFLGEWFFRDVESLKSLGDPENVRIIFWFDN